MIDLSVPLPIARQARLLGLSRAAVYYKKKRSATPATDDVLARVGELHRRYPMAGARTLSQLLRSEGYVVGRARMLKIMRYLEILPPTAERP